MEPTPDPATAKRDLRRRMADALERLDAEAARRAAERAADRILALPEVEAARRLLVCLSFGHELDTWDLVERLRRAGRGVYVPRAGRAGETLTVHPYPCPLETLSFGLRQPRADSPAVTPEAIDGTLDAALVAGLAFDRSGFRLGYGKGHFDRFLAGRTFATVGLGYRFQLLDAVPVEAHDVPLAAIVTDAETWRPDPAAGRGGASGA